MTFHRRYFIVSMALRSMKSNLDDFNDCLEIDNEIPQGLKTPLITEDEIDSICQEMDEEYTTRCTVLCDEIKLRLLPDELLVS